MLSSTFPQRYAIMSRTEFLLSLDGLPEKSPRSMKHRNAGDLGWDSLSVFGFIAVVDKKMGFTVSPSRSDKARRSMMVARQEGATVKSFRDL